MAGDWIKMRVSIRRDPKVSAIADYLSRQREFMDHITDPVRRSCDESVYEHITRDVTRAITVASLLEVWGIARDRGARDGYDLVLKHATLLSIDDMCDTPCFGEAMESVDWAIDTVRDFGGKKVQCVVFPGFFEESEAPESRYRRQHAEAQARYRERQKALRNGDKQVDKSDSPSDITSDITMTPREEKRREEEREPPNPLSIDPTVDRSIKAVDTFAEFWAVYPRREAKAAAFKAWKRLKPDADLIATIVAAVRARSQTPQWLDSGGKYVPLPATYLNGERWLDNAEAKPARKGWWFEQGFGSEADAIRARNQVAAA